MKLTSEELEELVRLQKLKAWGPRLVELERRAAAEATARWRQQDVFGDQAAPFEADQ